ncbi:MAG: hypothetical protein EA402_10595 [Planctomycetota bacterium]|nr:MAG: hypothetical protein EA402_10595 [Planctomycetota bacterium]
MRIGSHSWSLELDDGWQDCSENDVLRFFEPVSESVLNLSSHRLEDEALHQALRQRNREHIFQHFGSAEEVDLEAGFALLGAQGHDLLAFVHVGPCLIMITMASRLATAEDLKILVRSMVQRICVDKD